MKALFVAATALAVLAAGSALAYDGWTSSRAGTQVIGPTISRAAASQTTKQLSDAVAKATRPAESAVGESNR